MSLQFQNGTQVLCPSFGFSGTHGFALLALKFVCADNAGPVDCARPCCSLENETAVGPMCNHWTRWLWDDVFAVSVPLNVSGYRSPSSVISRLQAYSWNIALTLSFMWSLVPTLMVFANLISFLASAKLIYFVACKDFCD